MYVIARTNLVPFPKSHALLIHTPEAKLMSTVIPVADLLNFHLFLSSMSAER